MKNNIKKLALSAVVLALVFGVAFPALANNDSDKAKDKSGIMNFGQAKKIGEAQREAAKKIAESDRQAQGDLLKIGDSAFNSAFRAASGTFNKQISDAKKIYKQDKKNAHNTLISAVKSANGNQDAITQAFNAYRISLISALEKMFNAEQAAYNQFITTLKNFTVTPVTNHVPVAYSQSLKVLKNNVLAVALTGSDSDQNSLTYTVVSGPTHGTLSNGGVNQKYIPNTDYIGSDSFTFKVNDGSLDSPIATIYIQVVN